MRSKRKDADRIAIAGHYLDEVRIRPVEETPGTISYRGFPAQNHKAVIDGQRVSIWLPPTVAMQLFADGVLGPLGSKKPVTLCVGKNELGVFYLETIAAGDLTAFGSGAVMRFIRLEASG